MRTQLRTTWEIRSPNERKGIIVFATLLCMMLYLWLVVSATYARGPLRTSVINLRVAAARLEQQAMEYQQLQNAPPITASATDLRTLVQTQINTTGLARTLTRMDTPDDNHVVVVFGAVAFADWLKWVSGLALQHVRVESCKIEALSTAGLVSITATLVRTNTP